jgi:hypothetical protein
MQTQPAKTEGLAINPNRVLRGEIVKCQDGKWNVNVGKLLVAGVHDCLQHWQDGEPIETITTQPLPDVNDLNAAIPKDEWEEGLNGPRPPWQLSHIVYLIDVADGSTYTFASGTTGARIATDNLADRIQTMCLLRGENVLPEVLLSSKPMPTKFGPRTRPDFKIVDWRAVGNGKPKAIEHKADVGKTVEPTKAAEELNDKIPW